MQPTTIRSGTVHLALRVGNRNLICSSAGRHVTISNSGVHVTITDEGVTEQEWIPWHAVEGVEWVRKDEETS